MLNSILNSSILAFNTGFNEAGMSKNEHSGSPDEPEEGHHRRRDEKEGKTDDKEGSVKMFLGYSVFPHLHGFRTCREQTKLLSGERHGQLDAPNLLIAIKPPTKKPRAIKRSGLLIL